MFIFRCHRQTDADLRSTSSLFNIHSHICPAIPGFERAKSCSWRLRWRHRVQSFLPFPSRCGMVCNFLSFVHVSIAFNYYSSRISICCHHGRTSPICLTIRHWFPRCWLLWQPHSELVSYQCKLCISTTRVIFQCSPWDIEFNHAACIRNRLVSRCCRGAFIRSLHFWSPPRCALLLSLSSLFSPWRSVFASFECPC